MTGAIDAAGWGGFRLTPTLLAARLRMVGNAALRGGRERRGWTFVLVVLGAGLMLVGYRLTRTVLEVRNASPESLESPLAAGLGMLAGFTAVTAVTFALSALYFARDLETLLAAPVPPRAVLLSKLGVQLATGLFVGALLAGPPLLAYLGTHGTVAALPWVGLVVLSLVSLPLAAGSALTVLAVRLLPARRVRDAGGLLVTLTVFGVTAANLALRGPQGFSRTPVTLDTGRHGGAADAPWLPTGWAARSVVAAMSGDVATALLWGLPLVVAAAAALFAVARGCEAMFLVGYQHSSEAGRGRRRRSRASTGPVRAGTRVPWLAITAKDLRELRRDASMLGQLVLPLVLFALYIAAPTGGEPVGAGTRLPPWFGVVLTAGFASLFAASGVALRGVGSEGRRLWVLLVAPIDCAQVLRAKLATGVAVAGVLGGLLVAVGLVRERLGLGEALLVEARLWVMVAGLAGLAVGLGAMRPRLDWTDPRRSVGMGLSFTFLGMGSVYLALCCIVLGLPYAVATPPLAAVAAADCGLVLLAALVGGVSLRLGVARLRALEL